MFMKKVNVVIFIVLSSFILSGAACIKQQQVNKLGEDYKMSLGTYQGATKKQVLMSSYGVPTKKEINEGIEIWTYYINYGTQSNVDAYGNKYYAGANTSSWEMYDIIHFYFDGDKVIKTDYRVQR